MKLKKVGVTRTDHGGLPFVAKSPTSNKRELELIVIPEKKKEK